ncbi:MAG: SoxR reducing system RseC family protein [Elusimicrobiota bacterium]
MKLEEKLRIKGVVTGISDAGVDVKLLESPECEGCDSCSRNRTKYLNLPVEERFKEGDKVVLEVPCHTILKLSFLLYFLPAVFAFCGFLAGYMLKGNMGGFAGAVLMLAAGYMLIKKITRGCREDEIRVEKE